MAILFLVTYNYVLDIFPNANQIDAKIPQVGGFLGYFILNGSKFKFKLIIWIKNVTKLNFNYENRRIGLSRIRIHHILI